ncbi:MAG: head-tail joining protein [Alphaproteobacteria bacterium]
MAVESAADRAIFFDVDDFGTAATYTPDGGAASTVNGIFDNDFIEVDAGGGVGVALQQPRFQCRTADVSSAAEGDAIVISSVNYTVRIVQDDGTGMTTLVLEAD